MILSYKETLSAAEYSFLREAVGWKKINVAGMDMWIK